MRERGNDGEKERKKAAWKEGGREEGKEVLSMGYKKERNGRNLGEGKEVHVRII